MPKRPTAPPAPGKPTGVPPPGFGRPVRRLIGRDAPLARLGELVRAGARLVTVTGPPGVGKTTLLSHWLAHESRDPSEWTVCTLSAGRFRDLPTLARAVLCALGDEPRARPLEEVGPALARSPTLLVLDELDLVAAAAGPAVESWLVAAPELQIVTASRIRIGVPTEQLVELGALGERETRELLAACVDDLQPAWRDESAALAALARQTGGLPLAIELAASRCRVLSPEALLDPARARRDLFGAALRDTIETSVAALSGSEAVLFRRLALFEGPFSLGILADVLGPDVHLDDLQRLRDVSLVAPADDNQLMLLPPIREDAYRRLEASGELDELAGRHRAWVIERGESAVRAMQQPGWLPAFHELGRLHLDVCAALDRARQLRSPDAVRLVRIMDEVRLLHGSPRALWEDIDDLRSWDHLDRAVRAELATRGAALAGRRGDLAAAQELLDRARALDPAIAAGAGFSCERAMLQIFRGDLPAARAALEQAAASLADPPDRRAAARVHTAFVELLRSTGECDEAIRHGESGLARLGAGSPLHRASIHTGLAFVCVEKGDAAASQRYAREGLAALDAMSNRQSRTRSGLELALGRASHLQHDAPGALHAYRQAARGPDSLIALFARIAIGSLLAEQDRLIDARDQWQEIIDDLAERYPFLALQVTALLAAVEARLGQLDRARSRFERLSLPERLPPAVRQLVEDCRAVVEDSPEAPPDPPATTLEGRIARRLREAQRRAEPVVGLRVRALRVARDGAWFDASGTRVSLARRPVMRCLISSLAQARAGAPGRALGHDELLAAGWGNERMSSTSARRRVEVMISRIRALGLGDALETTAEGYRIHPDCQVEVDEGGAER